MSNRTSAARYARALFDVAQQEADLNAVQGDLTAVVAAMAESAELARVLGAHAIPDGARRAIVDAIGQRLDVSTPVAKLLRLLTDRRGLQLLEQQRHHAVAECRGFADATVQERLILVVGQHEVGPERFQCLLLDRATAFGAIPRRAQRRRKNC